MNSVYEPGPNDDSEPIPSRKTRSKTKPGARARKLAQLGTQARACLAMSWALRLCRGLAARSCRGLHGRIAAHRLPCRSAHARTLPRAQRPVPAPCPGLAVLYCNTAQPFAFASCHNTPRCIAVQCPAFLAAAVTIQ